MVLRPALFYVALAVYHATSFIARWILLVFGKRGYKLFATPDGKTSAPRREGIPVGPQCVFEQGVVMDANDFEGQHPFYFCTTRAEALEWVNTMNYCFIGEVVAFHWTPFYAKTNMTRWLMRTGPITLLPMKEILYPVSQLTSAVRRGDTLAAQQIAQGYNLLTADISTFDYWVWDIFVIACSENRFETAVWFADAFKLEPTELIGKRVYNAFKFVTLTNNREFIEWFWKRFQFDKDFTRVDLLMELCPKVAEGKDAYANFLFDKIGAVTDVELEKLFNTACMYRSLQISKFFFDKYQMAERMTANLRNIALSFVSKLAKNDEEFESWIIATFGKNG